MLFQYQGHQTDRVFHIKLSQQTFPIPFHSFNAEVQPVIISVSGEETDYRLAPVTKTYTVFIDKISGISAITSQYL